MPGQKTYSVEFIRGHNIGRRGLAFLICVGDNDIDAKIAFERLNLKQERELRGRFDYWLDGGTNDHWFHGWPNTPAYKDCFVFKWKQNKQNHRLYGFLSNPRSNDHEFRLCVLISHAVKNVWRTDPSELDGINKRKEETGVKEAVIRAVKV